MGITLCNQTTIQQHYAGLTITFGVLQLVVVAAMAVLLLLVGLTVQPTRAHTTKLAVGMMSSAHAYQDTMQPIQPIVVTHMQAMTLDGLQPVTALRAQHALLGITALVVFWV
jgi:hypothetical protein